LVAASDCLRELVLGRGGTIVVLEAVTLSITFVKICECGLVAAKR